MGGRGSSSGMTGGGSNQSEATRNLARNAQENNSDYKLNYTETMSGSTWTLDGTPKGPRSERGGAGAELSPVYQGEGYVLSKWSFEGRQLPKETYTSLDVALKATKSYLKDGWKKTKQN